MIHIYNYVTEICKAFLIAVKHRLVTYPDGLDIIKTYDHLFNIEEGNQLLDVIVAVNNYNVKDYGKVENEKYE